MSEQNPFSTPEADLELPLDTRGDFALHPPKTVSAGRGWGWIADGYDKHFRKSPLAWVLAVVLAVVIYFILSIIPVIGQIATMLTYYLWTAGFMIGCRAQDEGEPFTVGHLFAAFKAPGKLMALAFIITVLSVVAMVVAIGPLYLSMLQGGGEPSPEMMEAVENPASFMLMILFAMLLTLPVLMAGWFAPALIALHDVPLFTAIRMSFMGSLKNILPMLVYGVIAIVLFIVASIPLGLGLLVLLPVMAASVYVSYTDIFLEPA